MRCGGLRASRPSLRPARAEREGYFRDMLSSPEPLRPVPEIVQAPPLGVPEL
jgi:hypothetical protein